MSYVRFKFVLIFLCCMIVFGAWQRQIVFHFSPCQSLGFDAQSACVWQQGALAGILPFKDVFYPYGLLLYYHLNSVISRFLSLVVLPSIYMIVIAWVIARRYRLMDVFWLFVIPLISFILFVSGMETFLRYGTLLTLLVVGTNFVFSRQNRGLFWCGLIVGLGISFFNDQGIYAAFLLCIVFCLKYFLPGSTDFFHVRKMEIIARVGWGMMGLCLGCLPLVIFLIRAQAWSAFVFSFRYLADLTLVAKTPFIPFSRTPDNLFTFSILILGIFFVAAKLAGKIKVTQELLTEIALLLSICLLEQKSLIRSMDRQLTLYAFFLLLFFVVFYRERLLRSKLWVQITLSCLLVFLPALIGLSPVEKVGALGSSAEISSYQHVLLFFKEKPHDQIFSFPGDPIFYSLLAQKPPYFFTTYESSPLYAQQGNIAFMQNPKLSYVIYNSATTAIQDGVPEYVRAKEELKYLLTHFEPIKQIDSFVILKKQDKPVDVFTSQFLNTYPSLISPLLNVDLGMIPASEGKYKGTYPTTLPVTSLSGLSTKDLILFVRQKSVDSPQTRLVFTTREGMRTSVSFSSCARSSPCILNLSSLPLFYTPRILLRMEVRSAGDSTVQIKVATANNLW